jgi:hypothetical protein
MVFQLRGDLELVSPLREKITSANSCKKKFGRQDAAADTSCAASGLQKPSVHTCAARKGTCPLWVGVSRAWNQ